MTSFEQMQINSRLVSSLALPCEHQSEESKHMSLQSGWVVDCLPVTQELHDYCNELRKAMPSLRFGVDRNELEVAQSRNGTRPFSKCFVYRADDIYVMGALGFGTLGCADQDKYLIKSPHIENNMFCAWNHAHRCKATKNLRPAVGNALTYLRRPSDSEVLNSTISSYVQAVSNFLESERHGIATKMDELYSKVTSVMFGKHWEANECRYDFIAMLGAYRSKPENCRPAAGSPWVDDPMIRPINELANSYYKLVDTKTDVCLVHPVKNVDNELIGYNITTLFEQEARKNLSMHESTDVTASRIKKNLVTSDNVDQEIATKVATLSMLEEKDYTPLLGMKLDGDIYYVETNVEALPDDYYEREAE